MSFWSIIAWASAFLDMPEAISTAYELGEARNDAWSIAGQLTALPSSGFDEAITHQDRIVSEWVQAVFHPVPPIEFPFWIGYVTDRSTVAQTIDMLNEKVAGAQVRMSPIGKLVGFSKVRGKCEHTRH